MSIRAFELFGTVELKNNATAGLHKLDKDVEKTKRGLGSLKNEFSSVGAASSKMGSMLSTAAGNMIANLGTSAISGAADKMRDLTTRGMEYYDTIQMMRVAYKSHLGDQVKADEHLRELLTFARVTPFDDQPVLKYAQGLESVGVEAKKVTTFLTGMGNALSAAGNFSLTAQQGINKAIRDMLSKPTLMSEEVKGQAAEWVPSIMADFSGALGMSMDQFRERMEKGEIKSRPAVDLLVDYWNKKNKGLMQFAGENTFEGLTSSKRSAEAAMAANIFAGGNVMDPSPTGAGAEYLNLLRAEIARRDRFAQGGPAQSALGAIATKYLKAREADDAMWFGLAENSDFMGRFVQDFAKQPGQIGGLPLPTGAGSSIFNSIFGPSAKPLILDMPKLQKEGKIDGVIPDLFRNITGTSIDAIEKGAGPMEEAGALLGAALYKGIDSQWLFGSPSKKAIQLGAWIKEGLEIGLSKGQASNYANFKWLSEQSPDFVKKLGEVAGSLNTNPDFLLNVFARESSLNPMAYNPSGATGLFQLMPMHAKKLGLPGGPNNKAAFRNAVQAAGPLGQLDLFYRYITEIVGVDSFRDQASAYTSVFMPKFTNSPLSAVVAKRGDRNYGPNAGLDRNGDGLITKGELGAEAFGALGAGKFFSVNGAPAVSKSNPMPVEIVDFGNGVDFRSGPGSYGRLMTANDFPAEILNQSILGGGRSRRATRTIHDPIPVNVDVPISFRDDLPMSAAMKLADLPQIVFEPLKKLGEAATLAAEGLTDEEIARKRQEAFSPSSTGRRNKKFDAAFTWEGAASDFQGGFAGLLGSLGWGGNAKGLGKEFLFNFARDMQGRFAQDISAMFTSALFGKRGDDGKLSGGLFGGFMTSPKDRAKENAAGFGQIGALLASLFGGFRVSGGGMSAGRFYMAGERGPELIAGPGYVYNASQTRQMMGERPEQHIVFALGDKQIEEAISRYLTSRRGSRLLIAQAGRFRKILY